MRVEVGTTVDQAEERLRQAVMEAEQRKRECAQQLQESLEEYQRLGLRDAYMRLLKSQKAVVEERLRTSPDDAALSMHLSSVNACLKEVEDAAEATCALCYENLSDTTLNCGHSQFCRTCAFRVGTCPVCRGIVTSRQPTSALASASGYASG